MRLLTPTRALGLIGWSLTSLPHTTATAYAPAIADLQRTITLHRRSESSDAGSAGGSNLTAATCRCPRRIRVAPGTLAQGPIVCALCRAPFQAAKPS